MKELNSQSDDVDNLELQDDNVMSKKHKTKGRKVISDEDDNNNNNNGHDSFEAHPSIPEECADAYMAFPTCKLIPRCFHSISCVHMFHRSPAATMFYTQSSHTCATLSPSSRPYANTYPDVY